MYTFPVYWKTSEIINEEGINKLTFCYFEYLETGLTDPSPYWDRHERQLVFPVKYECVIGSKVTESLHEFILWYLSRDYPKKIT